MRLIRYDIQFLTKHIPRPKKNDTRCYGIYVRRKHDDLTWIGH